MPYRSVYWEDVDAGQRLPEIIYELSLLRLVSFVRATGLYDYVHFDRDYARAAGARDVFISMPHVEGLFSRLLTDWAGPEADIRSLTFSLIAQCCADDLLKISGRVGRKYIGSRGEHLVDITDMAIGHTLAPMACTASAVVALPSRVSGPPMLPEVPDARPEVELHPDLPDFARSLLGQVKESNPQSGRAVTQDEVCLWCESLEDWNPLYWDQAYAAKSRHGGTTVPPLSTFFGIGSGAPLGIGYLKPGAAVPHAIQEGLTGIALRQVLREKFLALSTPFSLPGYPEAAVANACTDIYRSVRPGERTSTRQEMLNCSGKKRTKLGEGYFLTWRNSTYGQEEQLIKATTLTGLFYRT
jgi:N-terminal half of MaoC dehydratase